MGTLQTKDRNGRSCGSWTATSRRLRRASGCAGEVPSWSSAAHPGQSSFRNRSKRCHRCRILLKVTYLEFRCKPWNAPVWSVRPRSLRKLLWRFWSDNYLISPGWMVIARGLYRLSTGSCRLLSWLGEYKRRRACMRIHSPFYIRAHQLDRNRVSNGPSRCGCNFDQGSHLEGQQRLLLADMISKSDQPNCHSKYWHGLAVYLPRLSDSVYRFAIVCFSVQTADCAFGVEAERCRCSTPICYLPQDDQYPTSASFLESRKSS